MVNENEQHVDSTFAVISKMNLRSSRGIIHSSPSLFSIIKGTDTYKKLSRQAYVRDDKKMISILVMVILMVVLMVVLILIMT